MSILIKAEGLPDRCVAAMLYRRNKGRLRGCLMWANLAVVGLLPLYLGLSVGLDVGQHRVVEGL